MSRITTAVMVTLMVSGTALAAPAQYPTKPIRMLIGFTPGSEVDVIARVVCV